MKTTPAWATCLLACIGYLPLQAQQCQNDSTGLIPISELGAGFFQGMQGGLYGGGSNGMPVLHRQHGIQLASLIQPLNAAGAPDPNGKIGFISIGMSNANLFFASFRDSALAYPQLNSQVQLVNCAVGGKDIDNIINPNDSYWMTVNQRLNQAQLSNNQVQVIWFEQAKHISGIPPNEGLAHIDTMERKFLTAFQQLRFRYPNLRQIFCSGRDYGGYSNPGLGNPEPYAYYTGWSFRKLVDRQMQGDTSLLYYGPNRRTAWLAWADYIWADGKNERSNGFNWLCPEDFQPDGVHPSAAGRAKVAGLLMNFFKSDTTTYWFRTAGVPTSTDAPAAPTAAYTLFPNPATDWISVLPTSDGQREIEVFNFFGQIMLRTREDQIDVSGLPAGVYFVAIYEGGRRHAVIKMVKP